ncbi:MAG: helix-turn-helix domain-containing protein [Chloroflexi bacterium]|nr:helix-turn-helix domain-containing protein [Chloroflexota bacterium]
MRDKLTQGTASKHFQEEISTIVAAAKYHLTPSYIARLARARVVHARKSGRDWIIDEATLREYLAQPRKTGPKPRVTHALEAAQSSAKTDDVRSTSSTGQTDPSLWTRLWADDLLAIYARGIAACQDLYFSGRPHEVEALLPLYCDQTALLARQPSPLQPPAASLASQAQQLACELATDREDFGLAQRAGQQAFAYAQLAADSNLQVASLIGLANLGWHRKLSTAALQAYKQAVSLLNENVTPLLKGRTYAGMAEVYAMRGQLQEAMRAMGLAYEHYPLKPEDDPAYPYLRASRYSLYVFGDAQTRLFLGQPKEADKALVAMQKETNDLQIEPITKVDMLYYQAEVQIQQGEIEPSSVLLTEAATLAKDLGSRLYFDKLAANYQRLQTQWPREPLLVALEDVFQPW